VSDFVTLCHCATLEAAQEARALLEAEGISVRIDGEHGSAIFGGSNSLLDVRVWVPPAQLEQAQRILDEFEGPQPDGDESEGEQGDGDENGEDGERDDEVEKADHAMPQRYPGWMRGGRRFTWPVLALTGLGLIARGYQFGGAMSLLFAVFVFALAQESNEENDGSK
jgi:hypothetical protein